MRGLSWSDVRFLRTLVELAPVLDQVDAVRKDRLVRVLNRDLSGRERAAQRRTVAGYRYIAYDSRDGSAQGRGPCPAAALTAACARVPAEHVVVLDLGAAGRTAWLSGAGDRTVLRLVQMVLSGHRIVAGGGR